MTYTTNERRYQRPSMAKGTHLGTGYVPRSQLTRGMRETPQTSASYERGAL